MILVQAAVNCVNKKVYPNKKVIWKGFLQMTVQAGIKLHSDEAMQALMQEFAPLEYLGVFLSKRATELTREQKMMP